MQSKFSVQPKQGRVLIFKNHKPVDQDKVINYMQNQKQATTTTSELTSDFFVSLLSLEPKSMQLQNPSLILIRTLIDSYQLVINQQGKQAIGIYFQTKLNQLLEQPQVQICIKNGDDVDLQKILEKMQASIKLDEISNDDIENVREQFRLTKSNSLVNYISMQEKLETEQTKALALIEEFDEQSKQFEEMRKQDLESQEQTMQKRLERRNKTHKSHLMSPCPSENTLDQ